MSRSDPRRVVDYLGHIHPEFSSMHPEIPWRIAYEMRNALSHGYFTVDHTIVWQTVQNDLRPLRVQIAKSTPLA